MLTAAPFVFSRNMPSHTNVRLTWIYLLIVLLIWTAPTTSTEVDGLVARQNAGVVFKLHHKPLIFNAAHIDLTLRLRYRLEAPILRDLNKTSHLLELLHRGDLLNNKPLIDLVRMLDNMTLNIYTEANAVYSDVAKVLSNPFSDRHARSAREAVQYISAIPGGFLGLAKQKAVDILYRHILNIQSFH